MPYGLVHDPRFVRAAGQLGVLGPAERLLRRGGLGLYTLALARRAQ